MTGSGPDNFIDLLELDQVAADLYIGHSPLKDRERVYGGQVVAQALAAATASLTATDHAVHSLHSYFIRSGDETKPIVFDVDRIRDGGSFSTRRVVARQAGGAIFNLSVSFHRDEPDAAYSASSAPENVPPPEDCIVEDWDDISAVRMVPDMPTGQAMAWIKIAIPEQLGGLDTHAGRALHAAGMAYCSDHIPMDAVRSGHPSTDDWDTFMGASLDHAVWFHRPTRADEWLLFVLHLQSLRGSRGVASGSVYDQAGDLVATITQEGLLRRLRTSAG